MSKNKTIRAWKNAEYRMSLSQAERALLPENPAGPAELSDAELAAVAGGSVTVPPDEGIIYTPWISCPSTSRATDCKSTVRITCPPYFAPGDNY